MTEELCVCGDRRSDHPDDGPCRFNSHDGRSRDLTHGFEDCKRFQFVCDGDVTAEPCLETGKYGCPFCSNEACNLCGAGCWSDVNDCEHDAPDRHRSAE